MVDFWKRDPVIDFWKNDPVAEVPTPPKGRPENIVGPLPGRSEPIVAPQKNVLAAPEVMTREQAALTSPEEAYFQGAPEPPKEPFDWRKTPGAAHLAAATNLGGRTPEDLEGLQKSLDVIRQQEAEREKNKTEYSKVREKKGFIEAAKADPLGLAKELGHEFMQGILPTAATLGAGAVGGPGGVAGGGAFSFGANAYANALINETMKFGGKLDDAKQFNETYLKNKEAIDKAALGQGAAGFASGALFGMIPGGGGVKGFLTRAGLAYPATSVGVESARREAMGEPIMTPDEVAEAAVKSALTAVPFEAAGALSARGAQPGAGRPPSGGVGPEGGPPALPPALPPYEPPMSPYRTETVFPALQAPRDGGPPTPPPSPVEARGKEPPPSPAAPTGQPTPPETPPTPQAAKQSAVQPIPNDVGGWDYIKFGNHRVEVQSDGIGWITPSGQSTIFYAEGKGRVGRRGEARISQMDEFGVPKRIQPIFDDYAHGRISKQQVLDGLRGIEQNINAQPPAPPATQAANLVREGASPLEAIKRVGENAAVSTAVKEPIPAQKIIDVLPRAADGSPNINFLADAIKRITGSIQKWTDLTPAQQHGVYDAVTAGLAKPETTAPANVPAPTKAPPAQPEPPKPAPYAEVEPFDLAVKGALSSQVAADAADKEKKHFIEVENNILGDRAEEWRKLHRQAESLNPDISNPAIQKIREIENSLPKEQVDALFGVGYPNSFRDWKDLQRKLESVEDNRSDAMDVVTRTIQELPYNKTFDQMEGTDKDRLAVIQHALNEEMKRGGDPKKFMVDALAQYAGNMKRQGIEPADVNFMVNGLFQTMKNIMHFPKTEQKPQEPAPASIPSAPASPFAKPPETKKAKRQPTPVSWALTYGGINRKSLSSFIDPKYFVKARPGVVRKNGGMNAEYFAQEMIMATDMYPSFKGQIEETSRAGTNYQPTPEMVYQVLQDLANNKWSQAEVAEKPVDQAEKEFYEANVDIRREAISNTGVTDPRVIDTAIEMMDDNPSLSTEQAIALAVAKEAQEISKITDDEIDHLIGRDLWNKMQKGAEETIEADYADEYKRIQAIKKLGVTDWDVISAASDLMASDPSLSAWEAASYAIVDEANKAVPNAISKAEETQIFGTERKEPSAPAKHEEVSPEAGKPGAERAKPAEAQAPEGAGPAKQEPSPAPSQAETLTAEKPKIEVSLPEPPKPEQMPVVPEEHLSIAEIQKMMDDNFIPGVKVTGSAATSQHPAGYRWGVKFPGDKETSALNISSVKSDVEAWIKTVKRLSPELKKKPLKSPFVKPNASTWFVNQQNGKPLYDDGNIALVRSHHTRYGTEEFYVVSPRQGIPFSKFKGKEKKAFNKLIENYNQYKLANTPKTNEIPFGEKISGSKNTDPRLLNTLREWAKMLGVDVPIHLTNPKDANEAEYYGAFEKLKVLGSGDPKRTGGIFTVKGEDGKVLLYGISINQNRTIESQLETMAHELGHAYQDHMWETAPQDVKDAIESDWKNWMKEAKKGDYKTEMQKKTPMLYFDEVFAVLGPMKTSSISSANLKYHLSFSEWFADQVSRWAFTADKPKSVVEKFFSGIADKLRMLWQAVKDRGFFPNETLRDFIDKTLYMGEGDVEPSTKPEEVREQKLINPDDFPEAQRPSYEAPKDSLMAHLSYGLVDALNDLYKAEKAAEKVRGAPLPDNMSGYLANELFNPRVMDRQKKVWENEIQPLLKALRADGITVEEMARFLYARHAPERNELMRTRDPARFTEDNGSGMTNADAKAILDEFRYRKPGQNAPSKYDLMDHIDRSYIRPIIARDLAQRLRSGLLTQEEYDALKRTRPEGGYNHYVPLRGSAESEAAAEPARYRVGKNFKVAGPEYFKALGRESEAYNPLFNLIQQRMEGIVRQEKNRVDQALYNFVRANPNPDFAEALTEANAPVVKYLGADGMVKYRVGINPLQMDQFLPLKVGGKQVYIKFNKDNPAAMRVIGVLRNQPANAVNPIVQGVGHLTRVFSKMNTTWVPNFFMTNFPRDTFDALLYLYGTKDGLASGFIPDLAKSIGTIAGIHSVDRIVPESERALYEEWLSSGGKFDYGAFETIASVSEKIQKDIVAHSGEKLSVDAAKRLGEKSLENLGHYMSVLNEVFEQAVRFAAYRTARRNGFTKDRAASLSQNVTVNFPVKGAWVKDLNNFIPFLGARIGSMRAIYRMSKNPRFLAGIAAFFAAQVMTSLLGVWMSDKDEYDPSKSKYYTGVAEWDRAKNIILPIQNKDGGFYKIPLPFFVAPFMTLGDSIVGQMTGNLKPNDAAMATMAAIADWANPLGSGSVWSSIQPGIFAPLLQLPVNRDWLNRPIHPDETARNRGVPSYDITKEKTPEWAANLSKTINNMTGGSDYQKGFVDVYPDTLNYLAKFFGGGVYSFVQSGKETIEKTMSGEPVKMEESPLTKRGVTVTKGLDEQKYYEAKKGIMEKENRFRAALDNLKEGSRSEEAKRVVKELGRELNISASKNANVVSTPELIRKIDKQNNDLKEAIDQTRANDKLSPLEQQSRIARYEKKIKDNMVLVRKTIEKRSPAD